MSETRAASGVAVVCERGSTAVALVEDYLRARGVTDAGWHAPRDVDEVEDGLRAGQYRRVVFAGLADFLALLWEDALAVGRWRGAGVAIEFAQPADAGAAGQVATILETWVQVRARRRRAQAVAGLVLSAVAVAAAFMLAALMR